MENFWVALPVCPQEYLCDNNRERYRENDI